MAVAQRTLPEYSSRFSRRDFTLSQLFSCLVLKCFLRTDFRGVAAMLADCSDLRAELKLKKVPHFTTLHKAHQRLLNIGLSTQLLDASVRLALGERPAAALVAGDSTGIDTSQISPHFIKRRSHKQKTPQITTYTHYPKLELLCDCATHLILAANCSMGPAPDQHRLRQLMIGPLARGLRIDTALFDAGYDSESNHVFLREYFGIRSVIPPRIGRPCKDPNTLPRGRWRRLMRRYRDSRYTQRAQAETTISMIKRRQGGYVLNRSNEARFREMRLKALTHNIMILLCWVGRVSTEPRASI